MSTYCEEKSFKETLLSISEAATNIRDRQDLYNAIMSKIHPIVKFDDAVILILSEDQSAYRTILTMASEERKKHRLYDEVVLNPIEVKNTPVEDMLEKEDFYHFTVSEWLQKYPEDSGTILMNETGLTNSVSLKLKKAGKVFGALLFHFSELKTVDEAVVNLYSNIADQISVAISNVLANEDIIHRENEKTLQINIANVFTSEVNWEGRFSKLMTLLNNEISFNYISFTF